jgi:hypothetical protein
MAAKFLANIRRALASLNPGEIREQANRRLTILLLARDTASTAALEDLLLPAGISAGRREEGLNSLMRAGDPPSPQPIDLLLHEAGLAVPRGWKPGQDAFALDLRRPSPGIHRIIEARGDLALALAGRFQPFRDAASRRMIHSVSKENAMFSILTALPNVIPNIMELPWAVGEFASDTAVLTANQIRMAFFLAAAADRDVGYSQQRNEIGSIIAGAWGWRAIARELVGKVPFGGGILPKAAIAYAGTYVVGLSLERIYRAGYALSREEREAAFEEAKERGKEVARALLSRVKGAAG